MQLEAISDDSELLQQAANDFWRRHLAGDALDPALAAYLVRRKDTPQRFAQLLKRHLAKPAALVRWPAAAAAPDPAALAGAFARARALWHGQRAAILDVLRAGLPGLNSNIYNETAVATAIDNWDVLLRDADARAAFALKLEKVELLGRTKLHAGAKKGRAAPVHAFFDAAQALLEQHAAATLGLEHQRLALLRRLFDEAGAALREDKRRRRVVAFDDMLFNLHQRLHDGTAPALAAALRARFPAALIDEFQDTDPLQWQIFDAIYGDGTLPLFLVGDPKQAIYSFRNADLHTYLRARDRATASYTLSANQRATAPLLDALNALFGVHGNAFMLDGLDYHAVSMGGNKRPVLDDRSAPRAALQLWTLPAGADGAPLTKAQARSAAAQASAAEIARLLAASARGEVRLGERPLRAGDIAVLVRAHAEGALVRQALEILGVGSVELSMASVYRSSDAEELERVLAAVLEPTRERVLRAALATEAMGLDAVALLALDDDEPAWPAIAARFAAYRDTWLARGVGFMLRQWLNDEHVAERLLVRSDGERRLTNLLHLAECLHQAASEHTAPDALLRWLQVQRRERRSDDSSQLRLESDSNLVQIVTVHKSKGLEYPVVFCPFLWNGRSGSPEGLDGVEYHDDEGRAVIDLRMGVDPDCDEADVKARVQFEAAAEALRLIYVALTRAVQRCVLVIGGYAINGSSNESRRSPLNWLVAGGSMSPASWLAAKGVDVDDAWRAWAQRHAPQVGIEALPGGPGTPLGGAAVPPEQLAALQAPPMLPAAWWIGSYSALMHGALHEAAAADHDQRVRADAVPARAGDDDDVLNFARGAAAGECLHAVFERIRFDDPLSWPAAIDAALYKLGTPPQPRERRMLQRLLGDVLNTPLPVGTERPLHLAQLSHQRRLVEMEFHLSAPRLDDSALNALFARTGVAVPRLTFGTLRGYLKGFIDLVFEHDGRYFVLDWKSNHLGDTPADYGRAAMEAAMAEHGYALQALLYSVALERHLRQRLPDYHHERHFGGALYLFVRGVRPGWRDTGGRPSGVWFRRPDAQLLASLSALIDGAARP